MLRIRIRIVYVNEKNFIIHIELYYIVICTISKVRKIESGHGGAETCEA